MATLDDVAAEAGKQAEQLDSLANLVTSVCNSLASAQAAQIHQIETLHQQLEVNRAKLTALLDLVAPHVAAPSPTPPAA